MNEHIIAVIFILAARTLLDLFALALDWIWGKLSKIDGLEVFALWGAGIIGAIVGVGITIGDWLT